MIEFTSNGKRWMMAEVPHHAENFCADMTRGTDKFTSLCVETEDWITIMYEDLKVEFDIIGSFYPQEGRIDFPVKEEWVEFIKNPEENCSYFKDYNKNKLSMNDYYGYDDAAESFISLLQSEIQKANIEAERVLIIKIK